MAINLNRVEVIGNLTRDPELRYTPNGQAVAGFAVATNRRYQDQAGNWVDTEPEYHEVSAWAKLGEGINKVLKKGDRVFVSGRLQTRSWEGQDGVKRYRTEMVADTIIGPDQVNRAAYAGGGSGPVVPASPTATPDSQSPTPPASPATSTTSPDSPATPATPAPATPASPASTVSDTDEINIEDIPF